MGRYCVSIRTRSDNTLRLAGIDLARKSDKNSTAVAIGDNEFGQRECERELTSDYIRRKVGCHSTNLHRYPDARSIKPPSYLELKGFQHAVAAEDVRVKAKMYYP